MRKILLVNASRYFIDNGTSLLDRKDFQVFMAPSVMQALQIHRRERVNLVVTDLHLPEIGGDILCSQIRQEPDVREVSTILICNDSPDDREKAIRCGANIVMKKPFTPRTLMEHVERLLAICVRRGYRVLLRARVKGATDNGVFFCTSQNLSVSGILIETDRELKLGDIISCSFYLPSAAHIVADGELARVATQPDGKVQYGIRFINLSDQHRQEIEAFVSDSIVSAAAAAVEKPGVTFGPGTL